VDVQINLVGVLGEGRFVEFSGEQDAVALIPQEETTIEALVAPIYFVTEIIARIITGITITRIITAIETIRTIRIE